VHENGGFIRQPHLDRDKKNVFNIVHVLPKDGQMLWPKNAGVTFVYYLVQGVGKNSPENVVCLFTEVHVALCI